MNTKARSASLATVVQKRPDLWPTPVVGDATGGRTSKGKDRPDECGLRLEVMKRERFPTPTKANSECAGGHRGVPNTLTAHARLWPTPCSSPNANRQTKPKPSALNGTHGFALAGAVNDSLSTNPSRQWPTPRKSGYKGTGPLGSKSHQHRLDRGYLDATVQDRSQKSGGLNPTWTEWLMGWPPEWTNPNCSLLDPTPDTWAHEPPGVSRLAAKSMPASERRSRLSIIGNGWVPQASAIVFARIVQEGPE